MRKYHGTINQRVKLESSFGLGVFSSISTAERIIIDREQLSEASNWTRECANDSLRALLTPWCAKLEWVVAWWPAQLVYFPTAL